MSKLLNLLNFPSNALLQMEFAKKNKLLKQILVFSTVLFAVTISIISIVKTNSSLGLIHYVNFSILLFTLLTITFNASIKIPIVLINLYYMFYALFILNTAAPLDVTLIFLFPIPITIYFLNNILLGSISNLILFTILLRKFSYTFQSGEFGSIFYLILLFMGFSGFLIQLNNKYNESLIAHQLFYDTLTTYPNRRKLLSDLKTFGLPILLLINIDDFKEINDVFGPKIGDMVLKGLGIKIKDLLEDTDCIIYKLAADEFAVVMESKEMRISRVGLSKLAENLTSQIAKQDFQFLGNEIRLRVTIGISDSRIGGIQSLLAQADMALKTAKVQHNPYLFFTQTIDTRENYQKNITWLGILANAIDEDRIVPFYQPIINQNSGKIEKYECLARLKTKEGEIINPIHFLDIAKKARLYTNITQIVFIKAAKFFNNKNYDFSINISIDDMQDPETVSIILEILQKYPNIENRVIFEILESDSIVDVPQIYTFIQLVKAYGCKIAIDDFGSGYSNFENIPKLNIDFIKINGELVKNIDSDQQNFLIVENIASFANKLGIKTIAEYVHNKEVYSLIKDLNIHYYQGHYFGEPLVSIRENDSYDKIIN